MPEQRTTPRNDLVPRDLFQAELEHVRERLQELSLAHKEMLKQSTSSVSRADVELMLKALTVDVRTSHDFVSEQRGRSSATAVYASMIGSVVSVIGSMIALAISTWALMH